MRIAAAELVERIWARDPSLWTGADENRGLGWLDEPMRMVERLPELEAFAGDAAGFEDVVLLGMGGSSLAPEVLRRSAGAGRFHVLDTTHPAAVRRLAEAVELERTLFLVASKSGSTLETRCHLDFFWERAGKRGESCVAITDPGSELESLAGERGFRAVFHNPAGFGLWLEQLLAESTGKEGKGLVPAPENSAEGGDRQAAQLRVDEHGLAAEFYRWEFATAVAGTVLEINPFDQPNVQEAKDRTTEVLSGHDPGSDPGARPEGTVAVEELLAGARDGDYVAVQAFVDPAREGELAPLVERARATGCVVTVGLGPRYLHSTGQLHKGGPATGRFLQVVDDPGDELPIPGRPFGFRRLIRAQADGDLAALAQRGRPIVRVELDDLEAL